MLLEFGVWPGGKVCGDRSVRRAPGLESHPLRLDWEEGGSGVDFFPSGLPRCESLSRVGNLHRLRVALRAVIHLKHVFVLIDHA
jgi:hypothetical protein